jgi:hypothetical protein
MNQFAGAVPVAHILISPVIQGIPTTVHEKVVMPEKVLFPLTV